MFSGLYEPSIILISLDNHKLQLIFRLWKGEINADLCSSRNVKIYIFVLFSFILLLNVDEICWLVTKKKYLLWLFKNTFIIKCRWSVDKMINKFTTKYCWGTLQRGKLFISCICFWKVSTKRVKGCFDTHKMAVNPIKYKWACTCLSIQWSFY